MCNYISIGGVSFILLFRALKILALRFKKRLLGSRFIYVSKNDSRQPATFYKWIGFVLETFVQLAPLFSPGMNERTGDLGLGESCKNWTDQRNTSKYLVGKQREGEREQEQVCRRRTLRNEGTRCRQTASSEILL